jgi:tetratricopeptide (TPR) repeat protein
MGNRHLDNLGQTARERRVAPNRSHPHVFAQKLQAGVAKQNSRQQMGLDENLEPVADSQDQFAGGLEVDEPIGQVVLQLVREDAPGGDVVAVYLVPGHSRDIIFYHDAEAAMPAYRRCAELYPDSKFAGDSLAKVVEVYMGTEDYAQADDLLEKVFTEYPDAKFLDMMLLKWVLVAFKRGDFTKAKEKCQQLLFEYPSSVYAETARKTLPQIQKAMNVEPAGKSAESEGGAQ